MVTCSNEDETAKESEVVMKVRYISSYYKVFLEEGKVYEAKLDHGFYVIRDERDDKDYGFLPGDFEVVKK